jgi:hypothetical protein
MKLDVQKKTRETGCYIHESNRMFPAAEVARLYRLRNRLNNTSYTAARQKGGIIRYVRNINTDDNVNNRNVNIKLITTTEAALQ